MTIRTRISAGVRRLGRWVRSLFAQKEIPLLVANTKGAKDVRSSDLGDRSGWLGKNFVSDLADDIQTAVLTDGFLLRAMHDYERLARQGGITLEPAKEDGISARKARRALKEVQDFLEGISTPFGESWEDLFYMSVLSLAVFRNFCAELVWQGGQVVNVDLLPWGSVVQVVDKKGIPLGWIQFDYNMRRIPFALQEIAHGHANRWPGDRYGTPELAPVSGQDGDAQALHQLEAMLGMQAEQNTFPYVIINFGSENRPVTSKEEQDANESLVENMLRRGALIGNGLVKGQVLEPKGIDLSNTIKHWKERAVAATGKDLLSLGLPEQINVATAEVLDQKGSQFQKAMVLSAAANWRRSIFSWVLWTKGIPKQYTPCIIPGEPNPVRREKAGKHARELGDAGYLTKDEVRRANQYPPLTDDQKKELSAGQMEDRNTSPQDDRQDEEDRKEDRQDKRTK